MVHHSDRRNHRIQREHGIEHHNLHDHDPEAGIAFAVARIVLTVFQTLVQLRGRFKQQEQATHQHNQVSPGEGLSPYAEQRRGQGHHPRNHGKQPQTHDQRQRQTDKTGFISLFRR